jgi:hypothetical protein
MDDAGAISKFRSRRTINHISFDSANTLRTGTQGRTFAATFRRRNQRRAQVRTDRRLLRLGKSSLVHEIYKPITERRGYSSPVNSINFNAAHRWNRYSTPCAN